LHGTLQFHDSADFADLSAASLGSTKVLIQNMTKWPPEMRVMLTSFVFECGNGQPVVITGQPDLIVKSITFTVS